MVISVHGTINGNHGADGVVLSCAATALFKLERKSIVLPLCNINEDRNIEYLAIGKEDVSSVYSVADSFTDTGIDALMRRAEAGRLAIDSFNNCTTPTVRSKNHLDIAGMTKEVDFEQTLFSRMDAVETIIASAKDVYDDIYLLVHSKNEALTNQIDKLADKVITVIAQGRGEKGIDLSGYEEDVDGNKKKVRDISVICEDYEEESKFNVAYLRKEYGVKNVFVAPHNAQYKDATNTGSVISYISSNSRDNKFDDNDVYIASITKLMEHVLGIKEVDIRDEIESKKKVVPDDERQLEDVDTSNIVETEVAEKKGFFGKVIFHKQVKITDSADVVNEFDGKPEKTEKPKKGFFFGKKEKNLLPDEEIISDDDMQPEIYDENFDDADFDDDNLEEVIVETETVADDSEELPFGDEDDTIIGEDIEAEEEFATEDLMENDVEAEPLKEDIQEDGSEGTEGDDFEEFEEIPDDDDEFEEIPDDIDDAAEKTEETKEVTDDNNGADKEEAPQEPVQEQKKVEEKPKRMTAADRIRMQQGK